jgi:hypothetical protein
MDARPGDNLMRNNVVYGALTGLKADGVAVVEGRGAWSDLRAASARQFWPKAGSRLIGAADSRFAPPLDFNARARAAPMDVGAYESDGRAENPGWNIRPEMKR